jgi:hypothetical protein
MQTTKVDKGISVIFRFSGKSEKSSEY